MEPFLPEILKCEIQAEIPRSELWEDVIAGDSGVGERDGEDGNAMRRESNELLLRFERRHSDQPILQPRHDVDLIVVLGHLLEGSVYTYWSHSPIAAGLMSAEVAIVGHDYTNHSKTRDNSCHCLKWKELKTEECLY